MYCDAGARSSEQSRSGLLAEIGRVTKSRVREDPESIFDVAVFPCLLFHRHKRDNRSAFGGIVIASECLWPFVTKPDTRL